MLRDLEEGVLKTYFTVDDFETDELAWWSYLDEKGSGMELELTEPSEGNESSYLTIIADIKAGGYGGAEMEFPEVQRLKGSRGIILKLKADKAGIPVVFVIWIKDPTQTSPFVKYKTPLLSYFCK